jgi:hypothetical protein
MITYSVLFLHRNADEGRCEGWRKWTPRHFTNFNGLPPVLVLCPTYLETKSSRLRTRKITEDIFVHNRAYNAYAITFHTGSHHFVAVFKTDSNWVWYDGLRTTLRYQQDLKYPQGHTVEHVVYIKSSI